MRFRLEIRHPGARETNELAIPPKFHVRDRVFVEKSKNVVLIGAPGLASWATKPLSSLRARRCTLSEGSQQGPVKLHRHKLFPVDDVGHFVSLKNSIPSCYRNSPHQHYVQIPQGQTGH